MTDEQPPPAPPVQITPQAYPMWAAGRTSKEDGSAYAVGRVIAWVVRDYWDPPNSDDRSEDLSLVPLVAWENNEGRSLDTLTHRGIWLYFGDTKSEAISSFLAANTDIDRH